MGAFTHRSIQRLHCVINLKMITSGFFLVSLFAFSVACKKKQNFVPVYNVPAVLEPYIDSFIAEGARRGHIFKKENLIMRYDKTMDGALCGSCNSTSLDANIQKIISIYKDNPCWTDNPELETLIFHELGHCFLGRSHTSESLPNRDPKSIMVPGNLGIYSPCIYPIGGQPCDNSFKRTYYLDELFDSNTPTPGWAH